MAVRDACTVGREFRYSDDQIAYHYTKASPARRGGWTYELYPTQFRVLVPLPRERADQHVARCDLVEAVFRKYDPHPAETEANDL